MMENWISLSLESRSRASKRTVLLKSLTPADLAIVDARLR